MIWARKGGACLKRRGRTRKGVDVEISLEKVSFEAISDVRDG